MRATDMVGIVCRTPSIISRALSYLNLRNMINIRDTDIHIHGNVTAASRESDVRELFVTSLIRNEHK